MLKDFDPGLEGDRIRAICVANDGVLTQSGEKGGESALVSAVVATLDDGLEPWGFFDARADECMPFKSGSLLRWDARSEGAKVFNRCFQLIGKLLLSGESCEFFPLVSAPDVGLFNGIGDFGGIADA